MRNIACFDVGGTFVKYGVVDENGDILFKSKFLSPKQNCKIKIPEMMISKIKEFQKEYSIHSVGISTAGKVDSEKGEIIFCSDNLPGYTGAKLSEEIKKFTGLDCFVENDVNAAALGESWQGAGKDRENFVCVTLGTGIGGAIIINGKLYKGVTGGSGEVGHIIINENGEECNCGSRGCYERYASTAALIRNYAVKAGISEETINGKDIFKKVKKGEELAVEVYKEFLSHIVTGLVNITHLFDPGLIVIGGGISEEGDCLLKDLNSLFKQKVMPSYEEHTEIVRAILGNDAGLIGACYIALDKK
jgi:glucokinase